MTRRRLSTIILPVALAAIVSLFLPPQPVHASMWNYCQVPPYVVQNIAPNVLILFDISGSMLNFAYSDGYNTVDNTADDRPCTDNSRCTQYNYALRDPLHRYYGYFDPNQWYTYGSNVFTPRGSTTGTRPANSWKGDFLNWLTMRRIDIMRKVLTGGRLSADKLDGEVADNAVRGLYKQITAEVAAANTPYNQDVYFVFNTGNSGTSQFDVKRVVNNNNLDTNIRVIVSVPVKEDGVLQWVGARARIGLEFYHMDDGGTIITNVGKDVAGKSSLYDTINQINLSRPATNTPIGESLWSAGGYFAQVNSIAGYNTPSDYGPNYANDYGTNANSDPMNFGTGGQPRYPICQKNFILVLTDGEPCSDGKLPDALLDYANGKSRFNCQEQTCPEQSGTTVAGTPYTFPTKNLNNLLCPGTGNKSANGSEAGVEDVALFLHTNDLRSYPTIGIDNISGFQNVSIYTVFAFGQNSTILKYAAINGGFEDKNGNGIPDSESEWDADGDGIPDTYYEAVEGDALRGKIMDAFSNMLKRASSGTAASVLASGEGSGANLIQAVFYPRRRFGNDVISWTGSLQNFWYHVDPFFSNATIREETDPADSKLNLVRDYIITFYFDPATETTTVLRAIDTNGDGRPEEDAPAKDFESAGSLWEAGKKLWDRDLTASGRTIFANLDGSSAMTLFSVDNASLLRPYMLSPSVDNATAIIRYIHGYDNTANVNIRNRTVTNGIDNLVWKLGDIVNSTPRIVAGVPLNKYDSAYNDPTYKMFIMDNAYRRRGVVLAGGNDGMLHAFRLGQLNLSWPLQARDEKAWITNPYTGTILGDEAWAFIPKNALPYLQYLLDPNYCHLYYTDLSPYVFDASIGAAAEATRNMNSWRTVVIGGMRTGGACSNTCATGQDCVRTPATDNGFSSYFALDVTDPLDPKLMWEFKDPNLGFATTGPAVVRIDGLNGSGARDRSLNGEWYVVVGSGPTGPIDNTNNQFLGRSNQNLRFFILNLRTGNVVQTIDTGIQYGFAGSLINSVADFNLDYQDDAIYAGYVKRAGTSTGGYTWTDGGVGRILTRNTTPSNSPGGGWAWSRVIDGIGPVTSSIARLQNKNYSLNWLFFGTGRYFFENPPTAGAVSPEIDDATGQRRVFGMKEPCFTTSNMINFTCSTTVSFSTTDPSFPNVTDFSNVQTEEVANSSGFKGWYIDLDPSSTIGNTSTYYTYKGVTRPFRSERVITDPLATTSGIAFFTTYKPYGDECALGGKSFLWALRYNTGGKPSEGTMKGKALVQVSTASVEQIELGEAFKPDEGEGSGGLHKDGRRTGDIEGVPPTAQGLSLLAQPPPVKRLMHFMER